MTQENVIENEVSSYSKKEFLHDLIDKIDEDELKKLIDIFLLKHTG